MNCKGYAATGKNDNRTSMSDHFRSGSKSAQVSGGQQVGRPQTTIKKKLLVQFLASETFMKRYEEARVLLGHRIPVDAPFEEVLGLIIEEFVDRHSPARKAERRKARAAASEGAAKASQQAKHAALSPRSRHIPAPVRDAVIVRDEGRCTFVARDGTRCQSRAYLQIDHVKPFSQRGGHDPANLRLLCAAHNRLEAERILGAKTMKPFRRRE